MIPSLFKCLFIALGLLESFNALCDVPGLSARATFETCRSGFAITNMLTISSTGKASRMDIDDKMSVLSWSETTNTIRLYHFNRTFVRLGHAPGKTAYDMENLSGSWSSFIFAGQQAEIQRWTNEVGTGFVVAIPPGDINAELGSMGATASGKMKFFAAGTLLNTNRLVCFTEATVLADPLSGKSPTALRDTNSSLSVTQRMRLVSICRTNLDEGCFTVPAGYTEVSEEDLRINTDEVVVNGVRMPTPAAAEARWKALMSGQGTRREEPKLIGVPLPTNRK